MSWCTSRIRARRAGLVAAILMAALSVWSCRAQAASCEVCGRHECTALAFSIVYADGGTQQTCCPRCASHAVAESPDRPVARLIAHDFTSGEEIDARTAVYVDGSDFEHCSAPKEERAAPGCCRTLAYDRCLPSLIAFRSAAEADAFSRDHGGTIKSFEDLSFGRK